MTINCNPQRDTRKGGTHIDTLMDHCPKSRRRVRKTLGLSAQHVLAPSHPFTAQAKARQRETHSAIAFAEKARK